jgi:hypothetical protein
MTEEPRPNLIDCPNCKKPLVLSSIENYSRLAHLSSTSSGDLNELPGDIRDRIMGENIDSKYAGRVIAGAAR